MDKTCYRFNPETAEYVGVGLAQESPLEPGIWLLPANATFSEPPAAVNGKTRHFVNNAWQYRDIPVIPDPVPTAAEMIAAAHARINMAYEAAFAELTAGYPPSEVASWQQQKEEADAWKENDDDGSKTPWVKGAASARGISVSNMVNKIKRKANTFSPAYGELTGKRQRLRDAIDALGSAPTQQQLDAIQW